jgi:hypothetical protein
VSDYLTTLAERIRALIDPSAAPEHPLDGRLFLLYALLALVKGSETTREDVHNAWVVWMLEVDEDHDALLPFAQLSESQRDQDQPFLDAIHQVATERS